MLAKVKQQPALSGWFSEVGVADLFWKSRVKRRLIRRASGVASAAQALVVTPMAAKDFVGFMSRTRSTPLRFGTASPALSPLTVGLAEPCGFSTGGLGEL